MTFTRDNNEEQDTGLVLAVERRLSSVTSPVSQLAKTLFREALAALVVISLWAVFGGSARSYRGGVSRDADPAEWSPHVDAAD